MSQIAEWKQAKPLINNHLWRESIGDWRFPGKLHSCHDVIMISCASISFTARTGETNTHRPDKIECFRCVWYICFIFVIVPHYNVQYKIILAISMIKFRSTPKSRIYVQFDVLIYVMVENNTFRWLIIYPWLHVTVGQFKWNFYAIWWS